MVREREREKVIPTSAILKVKAKTYYFNKENNAKYDKIILANDKP